MSKVRSWGLGVGGILLLMMSGCAVVGEGVKGFAGVSTKVLEDNRKTAAVKTFNYDYSKCYAKIKDIIKDKKFYIYSQDKSKHFIAIYLSQEDTTPVGIFLKEIGAANTQVEISSPSTYAKEFVYTKVFNRLSGIIEAEEEKKK